MANAVFSGLAAISAFSGINGWDTLDEIVNDIKKIGCWFHQSLPENKALKLVIYTFGSVVLLRSLPMLLRKTELFISNDKEVVYFHRSNRDKEIIEIKKELLKVLKEKEHGLPLFENDKLVILELNVGGGTNISYYPDDCHLIGTDMVEESKEKFEQNHLLQNMSSQFIKTPLEELYSVPDKSVSCVVSFHSLCSARSLAVALQEIKRILLPGGKLYFIEHTLETERFSMLWIMQLNWGISFLTQYCCLRKTEDYIDKADFAKVLYKQRYINLNYLRGPLCCLSPHVYGYAIK